MKSVQIRRIFWSVFCRIRAGYGKIRTRKNSIFGHFSHSAIGTVSTPNRAAFNKNLTFLHHLPSALLLTTENSSNCLHFVNIISNIGSCGDGLRKKNQSRTRQEFFLNVFKVYGFYMVLNLVLGQALLYVKKLPSLNTKVFTQFLSYIIAKKNLANFFTF